MPPVEMPKFTDTEAMMKWMGMDGLRWTEAFLQLNDLGNAGPDFRARVHSWFANAIERGRSSEFARTIPHLAFMVNTNARSKGWWDDERTFGDVCTLIHTEVSEAYEEFRNNRNLDERYYSLPKHRTPIDRLPEELREAATLTQSAFQTGARKVVADEEEADALVRAGFLKPEGIPSELADVVIRVFDAASQYGIDLEHEIMLKMEYNATRQHRHGGKRT
jgi:NTP pyrophosphatase (non-canonical NTP hydrolase)